MLRPGAVSSSLFFLAAFGVAFAVLVGGAGATAASPSETCFAPNCPITINDNPSVLASQDQAASPYPSRISFPHGDPCCSIIDKVTVTLTGLTHASLADVDVLLVREALGPRPAQVIELMSDVGAGSPATNLNLTFDDSAGPLPASGPVAGGTYRPTNYSGAGTPCAADNPPSSSNADPLPAPAPAPPVGGYGQSLGVFSGTELSGETWHLYVGDDCFGGSGSISSWSLTFFLGSGPYLFLSKSAAAATVTAGSPISFRIDASEFAPEESVAAGLYDPLPAGTGIDWSISPPYSGPGSCSITGAIGSETLSCDFGFGFGSAQVHVTSQTSTFSCGTYSNYAVLYSANFPAAGATASTTVVGCPTAATVTSFAANPTRGGVLLRWRHASETMTLGFNVYREDNGRRVKQSRALIPARPRGGRAYSWLDRRAPRHGQIRYWLQEISLDGRRSWHGPKTLVR